MAWSAPYTNSLVPETNEGQNEGVQTSNPFTSSETQQANVIVDSQPLRRQETNRDSKNSYYVPPDAIFASTGSASGHVNGADAQQKYHSHTEATPIASQENTAKVYEGEESISSIHRPSRLTSDHPAKERPQSLLTNLKDTGQKPKKGILKTNESSSIRFSTACAVQMSRTSELATGSPGSCSTGREIEIDSSGIVV